MESGLSEELSQDSIKQMLQFIKASMEQVAEEVSVMAETLESLSVNTFKEMS